MGRLHLKRHLYEERIMLSTFYIQEIKESYQVVHMQRQWPKFSILMTKLQAYVLNMRLTMMTITVSTFSDQ